MPNRTIYLPDALDQVIQRLGLNLSQLTQNAIRRVMAERSDEALEARIDACSARISALNIDWPDDVLDRGREEAGER